MRTLTFTCLALALLVTSLGSTANQTPATLSEARQKIDLSKLGPQIGERVPNFSLTDQTGKTRTLESIMGPKGAMLVFYRSADW